MINYDALERVIEREGKSNEWIADALGLTVQGWKNKRYGKYDFTISNAQSFSKAFDLTDDEKINIFLN